MCVDLRISIIDHLLDVKSSFAIVTLLIYYASKTEDPHLLRVLLQDAYHVSRYAVDLCEAPSLSLLAGA